MIPEKKERWKSSWKENSSKWSQALSKQFFSKQKIQTNIKTRTHKCDITKII